MDSIMEMARELGYELQNDERFVRVQMARSASDADVGLQDMIGEFNLKRIALSTEMNKDEGEQDKDKLEALDTEIREVYGRLMANEHMAAYQEAKQELDRLVNSVVAVITMSAQGQDPDEIEEGCGGNCGGCSGCH